MSDISKADGITLDEFVLLDEVETSESFTFPQEEPTRADFGLWDEAISHLCSGMKLLPYPLGKCLQSPHLPCQWFTTLQATEVYHTPDNPTTRSYEIYKIQRGRISTRYGLRYEWHSTCAGLHPGTHYTSVTMASQSCIILHSSHPFPAEAVPPVAFHEVLESFGNNSLWENMVVD